MARFQRLRELRNVLYTRYLGATNVCTTCGLLCLGDVLIQGAEVAYSKVRKRKGDQKEIDFERTGRVFQVGIPSGLVNHFWYKNLDKWYPGRTGGLILRKVVLDTLCAGPVFLTIYFYGIAKAEGKTHEESWQVVKNVFIPVYTADICYWPLMQALNFYLIPSRYRVLAISVCQLVWNSFLSFMKHVMHWGEETPDSDVTVVETIDWKPQDALRIDPGTESSLSIVKQRATVSASSSG